MNLIKTKERTCKYCNEKFKPEKGYPLNKYCSIDHFFKLQNDNRIQQIKSKKKKPFKVELTECICKCGNKFRVSKFSLQSKKICPLCAMKKFSAQRMGKGNPNYQHGLRVGNKKYLNFLHLRECGKYKKAFLEKHGYLFCEHCSKNHKVIKPVLKFEVHHIIMASQAPKHKNLHNDRNKILMAIQCHNDIHAHKLDSFRDELIRKRKLKELFPVILQGVE